LVLKFKYYKTIAWCKNGNEKLSTVSLTALRLGSCYKQVSVTLPDCTNIYVELVLNPANVLPHMLTTQRPSVVHSADSHNTKASRFNYLRFGKINRL